MCTHHHQRGTKGNNNALRARLYDSPVLKKKASADASWFLAHSTIGENKTKKNNKRQRNRDSNSEKDRDRNLFGWSENNCAFYASSLIFPDSCVCHTYCLLTRVYSKVNHSRFKGNLAPLQVAIEVASDKKQIGTIFLYEFKTRAQGMHSAETRAEQWFDKFSKNPSCT